MFERSDLVSWQTTSTKRLFGVVIEIDDDIARVGSIDNIGDAIYIDSKRLQLENDIKIIQIEGFELQRFLADLIERKLFSPCKSDKPNRLCLMIKGDQVAIQVNDLAWDSPIGSPHPIHAVTQPCSKSTTKPEMTSVPVVSERQCWCGFFESEHTEQNRAYRIATGEDQIPCANFSYWSEFD